MRDALTRLRSHMLRRAARLAPRAIGARIERSEALRRRERLVRDIHEHARRLSGGVYPDAVVLFTGEDGCCHVRIVAGPIDDYDLRRMCQSAHERRHRRAILIPELP